MVRHAVSLWGWLYRRPTATTMEMGMTKVGDDGWIGGYNEGFPEGGLVGVGGLGCGRVLGDEVRVVGYGDGFAGSGGVARLCGGERIGCCRLVVHAAVW
ncbi:hypothetical protein Tco_0401890 [Tanacetum coccineum]